MDSQAGSTLILNIFKIGGTLVDDRNERVNFIRKLNSVGGLKLIVHGGGKSASEMSRKLGIAVKMAEGRRITDEATLKVVTMTYAGWINKSLVADLQAAGINSLGMTGADANIIEAHKRTGTEIDYGYAGDIDRVNTGPLAALLLSGITPVLAPVTHDVNGQLLNTNADTIAATVAGALAGEFRIRLLYIMDKPGVMMDPSDEGSVIKELMTSDISPLHARGVISDGMVPKLHNAETALRAGVESVYITNVDHMDSPDGYGTALIQEG